MASDGTGKPRNLTPGEFEHSGISWLRDSSAIVTSAQRHETWDRDHARDLYVVTLPERGDGDAGGANVRPITAHDGRYSQPSVSPDGTRVAFIGAPDPRPLPAERQGGHPADRRHDPSARRHRVGLHRPRPHVPADRRVTRTGVGVGLQPPGHRRGPRRDAPLPDFHRRHRRHPRRSPAAPVSVSSFDAAAAVVARAQESATHPSELYVADRRVTHVGDDLASTLLGWEHFTAPTTDGTDEIDAWIMRPADFDETKRYPVLLNVHGGPHTQYGEYVFDEFQMQAAAGFVVVAGNPRGSSGRHTGWGQAIQGPNHPTAPGPGWGTRRRRRRPRDHRHRARPLRLLRPRPRRDARRFVRRIHGHLARRPPRRPVPCVLLGTGGQQRDRPRVVVRHLDVLRLGPWRRPPRRTRRVRADVADHVRCGRSTRRC